MSVLLRFLALVLLLGTTGCFDAPPASRFVPPSQTSVVPQPSVPAPPEVAEAEPVIEVTEAAQKQLHALTEDIDLPWQVRVEVVAGGCSGMYHKLSLDVAVGPEDTISRCGTVRCVFRKEQLPFVQGSQIDWITKGHETGFAIKIVRQTPENKEKLARWVRNESEKRMEEGQRKSAAKLAQLRQQAEQKPNDVGEQLQLAEQLRDMAKYQEAVPVYERVLQLAPNHVLGHLSFGTCLTWMKEKERAAVVFRAGKALAEKYPDRERWEEFDDRLKDLTDPDKSDK